MPSTGSKPEDVSRFGREQLTEMYVPGNSNNKKAKAEKVEKTEEKKTVKKVVSGNVIKRKQSLGSKVVETFTGDDARSVGSYILFDVIIPAAKNMLADAASQGAERLLFGDTRGRSKVNGRGAGYTTYSKMYQQPQSRNSGRQMSSRARSSHNFDEIILDDRGEAEEVLDQLTILIDDYGHAKVSDLYEMVGITGHYTDDKWGWTNLASASTSRVRQGYLLDLPAPTVLD